MSFRFKKKSYKTVTAAYLPFKKKVQNIVVFVNVDMKVIPPGLITVDVWSFEVMKDWFLCNIKDIFIHVFICSMLNESYLLHGAESFLRS